MSLPPPSRRTIAAPLAHLLPDGPPSEPPSTLELLAVFARIGLTSFGGGLSGWLLRIFVQERRWVDEEDFLNGLALAQALPGVNVKNMAIWIGYRLRGTPGVLAALFGLIVPPAVLIVLLAEGFEAISGHPATRLALDGAAAAAIGLSASMGVTVALRVPRRATPLLAMAGTFAAVGLLHWPLLPVVLGAGTLSVGLEYVRVRRTP